MNHLDKLFYQAQLALQSKDYTKAKHLLRDILKQDKNYAGAWRLYARLVPPEKRQKYIDRAVALSPKQTIAEKVGNNKTLANEKQQTTTSHKFGKCLLQANKSKKWQALFLVIAVIVTSIWVWLINGDPFQEYWALVLSEGTIFVETIYLDAFDFGQIVLGTFVILLPWMMFIAGIGHKITIYEYGIEEKTFWGLKQLHWAEVSKAEYVEKPEKNIQIFSFKLKIDYEYDVLVTNGKQTIGFGADMQRFPDAGYLATQLVSEYIQVNSVTQFTRPARTRSKRKFFSWDWIKVSGKANDIMRAMTFICIGMIFLIMSFTGAYTYIEDSIFVNNASVSTGTITEKLALPNPNGDTEPLFYIVYEFPTSDGTIVSDEVKVSYREYIATYFVGSTFDVHYDPENYHEHIVDATHNFEQRRSSLLIVFGISILGFIIGGVLFYFRE